MNEIVTDRYEFSEDYFSFLISDWLKHLGDRKGLPGLRYLEIGVFEGRSLLWMLDNILTHDSAEAVAVDPYFGRLHYERFQKNLETSGHARKVKLLRDISQRALRNLEWNTFDLIYVDGDHRADSAITDCVLAWPLLKNDGVMIIDNYDWHRDDWSIDVRPELAIDGFMTFFADQFVIVERNDRQVMLRKIPPVSEKRYCSRIGQYAFFWLPLEGYDFKNSETGECFTLAADERRLLMEGFREKKWKQFQVDREIFASPKYEGVVKKYGIKLAR